MALKDIKSTWDGYETYVRPLIDLANTLYPKKILEVGMGYEAYSTNVWLECCGDAHVTVIDKRDWGGNAPILKQDYGNRFKFIEGRSENVMPKLKEKFDFIYIDGDHRYEGVKADIENAIKLLESGGVLLLDDYGVAVSGGLDVDDEGRPMDGMFGVGKAADELLGDWKRVYENISFANGARAYVAP